MADRVCTNFIDDDGLDIGCHLVSKEYVIENYPDLVPWMKTPALWTWGPNASGRLGINSIGTINISSPVQTVSTGTDWKQTSASSAMSAAIKTDGTLWLWGDGAAGKMGNNSILNRSSPVQTVSNVTTWKSISATGSTVAAIKTDGTLWMWGEGTGGKLGNNAILNQSSPVQTVSNVTTWKSISNGSNHSTAVKIDGTLWVWGLVAGGAIGNQSNLNISSPVQTVSNVTTWKSSSAGGSQSAAIKTDGTLWLWGCGIEGRLGTNSTVSVSSPVQTVSSGTNWKNVSVGLAHNAAIKTDGTLWLWGSVSSGKLGDLSSGISHKSSPVQTVSGGTNWFNVSAGDNNTGAIKTDGTLWMWGGGNFGTLGNNIGYYYSASSPVQTISGGSGWKQLSVGALHITAIRDEGEF